MKGRALSLENHADFRLDGCRHDNRLGFLPLRRTPRRRMLCGMALRRIERLPKDAI